MPEYKNNFNSIIFSKINAHTDCLDVGCWTGNLGRLLIADKQCKVDGIDINALALKSAKKNGYRNVYKIDLNNDYRKINSIKNKYDWIILADVLEHTINPNKILKALNGNLKKNGRILISVPNISFILYRLLHFFGIFEYNPKGGVMDITHLRFFTKTSIYDLVSNSNYEVISIEGYNLVRNLFKFLIPLGRYFPSIFALQILVIAKNKSINATKK